MDTILGRVKERIKFEKFFFFRYVEIVIFGLDIDKKLFFYAWWNEILLFKNPCFFFFFFRKIEIKRTEGRNSYFLKLILKRSKINSTLFAYFRVYRITFCR